MSASAWKRATPEFARTTMVRPAARMGRLSQFFTWAVAGSTGIGLLSLLGFSQHFGFTAVSFCYLLLIVALALAGDFAASAFVSILAVVCLDYFFVEPLFSFRVAHPLNALMLVCFLVTSLVITGLVAKVRDKAQSSYLQNQKMKQLYDLAQQLLGLEPEGKFETRFMEPFCGIFGITAACLFDADTAEFHTAGVARDWLQAQTREAYIRGVDKDDRDQRVSFRCIRLGDRAIGAVGFEHLDEPELTAGPLTALAAAFLERTHAFRNAKQASDAVQSEEYRTVILHALAHEFKTPLSTILAAAGAIREAGSLGPEHREMAEMVESEAARLGRLTSRLLRTARLEREEIKPWMELIDIGAVVTDTVSQYSKLSAERRITVLQRCASSEVLADPELLQLAVSQLIDNACKYSSADFPVTVIVARQGEQIVLQVLSSGTPIPPHERSRIFDRFYRGSEARRIAPGTGLGLYVARKIALAHGGNLDLDDDQPAREGATFRLTIPVAQSERDDVATTV